MVARYADITERQLREALHTQWIKGACSGVMIASAIFMLVVMTATPRCLPW